MKAPVSPTDLAPAPIEIAEAKAEWIGLTNQFNGFHSPDARDLSMLLDEQFDAALVLGPDLSVAG
ncbi:hypothetical protein [Bacillus sp. REN3]|uniref:hypothetical protein n=1 Tax=Bacillus sp. REN3 TaxID=2802440 RepID=UPI001AEE3F94|nr:hypothetical protein [Bacillus sp. REN3]